MSNPSGTGPEAADSDPVTEVIDVAAHLNPETGSDPEDALTAEDRRYTAPGFDAGSTQIIDRFPDPPTEFIATHTESADTSRPRTGPQQILPARRSRPGVRAIAAVVALLVVATIVGLFLWQRNTAKASQENRVRTTIETFDSAVRGGDLTTLRTVTCGQTRKDYDDYDQKTWSDTYAKVAAAKPV